MFTTLSRYSLLFTAIRLLCSSSALAESPSGGEVQYFKDPELDYWKTSEPAPKVKPAANNTEKKVTTNPPIPNNGKAFQWNKYLSPSNDEFFKEGDYTPPAPFMEIARNPSDANIENWFKYLETKNELLRNLQQRLGEYSTIHPQPGLANYAPSVPKIVDEEVMAKTQARVEAPVPIKADSKNFRMRLYFDSHCPHCQKMLGTVAELMRMGYWVELKQVDKDTSIRAKIPFAVSDAAPEELKRYQIESVPLLLVGNLKKQTFSKIQGYHEAREVLSVIAKK